MKHPKYTFILLLLLSFGLPSLQAQSKSQLRKQVSQLQNDNAQMTKDNLLLKRRNDQLVKAYESLETDTKDMRGEMQGLQKDLDSIAWSHNQLKLAYEELKQQGGSGVAALPAYTSSPVAEPASTVVVFADHPEPNDTRKCANLHYVLPPNTTYTLDYQELNSAGWGVQVYSFGTLCKAADKAAEFSAKYKLYKTYIRVKDVKGKRTFSVIYGSLKDHAQAKTYCQNFRKIAKDPSGKSAFLVQHTN